MGISKKSAFLYGAVPHGNQNDQRERRLKLTRDPATHSFDEVKGQCSGFYGRTVAASASHCCAVHCVARVSLWVVLSHAVGQNVPWPGTSGPNTVHTLKPGDEAERQAPATSSGLRARLIRDPQLAEPCHQRASL